MPTDPIAAIRRFHRLVTKHAGALDDHFLGRDRPLGESRVLWEIGREGADLRDLRVRLDLDSGYLSRLVHSLASKGLVDVEPDPADERVRRARLTEAGRIEVDEMDRRSDGAAAATLAPLTAPQRARLVAAMTEVNRLLGLAGSRVERLDPADVRARRCVARYFAELDDRFEGGFDHAASIAADDADLVPPRGVFLAVTVGGEAIACGALKRIEAEAASIKRMWVDPSFRGLGLGRRMLAALEDRARELGFDLVRLETNGALGEAIGLYRTSGYREVEAFNDDPYAQHWFEKRLG